MNGSDVVVVGLGAHGAALVHELARQGAAVTGIDSSTPPHAYGSTTGRTRITREAYYEHPVYVPLVQRAGELWAELEELTGTILFRRTGGLMAGPEDGELVRGALASALEHGLSHERLDDMGIRRLFPAFDPPPGAVGVYEPSAGVLLVDACMRTLLGQAAAYGATLMTGVRVTGWRAGAEGVTLHTTAGDVHAARAVFTAGAWLNHLLASERDGSAVCLELEVERQTTHWFAPAPGVTGFRADACPLTMLEHDDGCMLYTLPDVGHGVKAGVHHSGSIVDPDAVDRTIGTTEEERVRSLLEAWMPGATHRVLDGSVCLYTNTPDRHFAMGAHPAHDNVVLVSACSGHGFKFAPALAEIAAGMVLDGVSELRPGLFDIARVVR
jgi:sarcosine oxidase